MQGVNTDKITYAKVLPGRCQALECNQKLASRVEVLETSSFILGPSQSVHFHELLSGQVEHVFAGDGADDLNKYFYQMILFPKF